MELARFAAAAVASAGESPQPVEAEGTHAPAAAGEHGAKVEHEAHGGVLYAPLQAVERSTGVAIPEFAVWGWLIAILLAAIAIRARRSLSHEPKPGISSFFELCFDGLSSLAKSFIGPGYEKHLPFVGALFMYILCCNLTGVIPGVSSPTGAMGPLAEAYGLNTTLALALCAFVYVQVAGFRQNGLRYLMHFVGEPVWLFPLNLPIHIIGELARPLSLAVRLYGNVGGEDKILHVLAAMFLVAIPLHWPLSAFAVFTGFLQAFVFVGLVCAYLQGTMAHQHEEHAEAH